MSDDITREQATAAVLSALRGFGTESELAELGDDDALRAVLELDSLDFLTFVEKLTATAGLRIEEDDYPRLQSLRSCVDFLTGPPR